MLNSLATRHCEICPAPSTTTLTRFSPPDWPLVACDGCGFVFLERTPDYDQLVDEFAWEKQHAKETKRRLMSVIGKLDKITRLRTHIGRAIDDAGMLRTLRNGTTTALEIGCGWDTRIPEPIIPFGIEISATMAAAADVRLRQRGGSALHAPALTGLAQFPDKHFDAILMRSYLEHERSARRVLQESRRVLKDGGSIYVRVPNYGSINRRVMGRRWCGFRFPDHVNYFTPSSLKALASAAGFSYRRINWLSPFDDNIICLLSKS